MVGFVEGWLCMCGHCMQLAVHGIGGARSHGCCIVAFLALHACVLH